MYWNNSKAKPAAMIYVKIKKILTYNNKKSLQRNMTLCSYTCLLINIGKYQKKHSFLGELFSIHPTDIFFKRNNRQSSWGKDRDFPAQGVGYSSKQWSSLSQLSKISYEFLLKTIQWVAAWDESDKTWVVASIFSSSQMRGSFGKEHQWSGKHCRSLLVDTDKSCQRQAEMSCISNSSSVSQWIWGMAQHNPMQETLMRTKSILIWSALHFQLCK